MCVARQRPKNDVRSAAESGRNSTRDATIHLRLRNRGCRAPPSCELLINCRINGVWRTASLRRAFLAAIYKRRERRVLSKRGQASTLESSSRMMRRLVQTTKWIYRLRTSSSAAQQLQRVASQPLRRCAAQRRLKWLILLILQAWLAALDDFRNWLVHTAA